MPRIFSGEAVDISRLISLFISAAHGSSSQSPVKLMKMDETTTLTTRRRTSIKRLVQDISTTP